MISSVSSIHYVFCSKYLTRDSYLSTQKICVLCDNVLSQALLPYPPSRLSLMFIQPAGYSVVANTNLGVADRSGAVFSTAVREVLQMYGAYECQEYECTFMAACTGPRIAAEVGLALHEWLLQVS